jgi:hypothetical protein
VFLWLWALACLVIAWELYINHASSWWRLAGLGAALALLGGWRLRVHFRGAKDGD